MTTEFLVCVARRFVRVSSTRSPGQDSPRDGRYTEAQRLIHGVSRYRSWVLWREAVESQGQRVLRDAALTQPLNDPVAIRRTTNCKAQASTSLPQERERRSGATGRKHRPDLTPDCSGCLLQPRTRSATHHLCRSQIYLSVCSEIQILNSKRRRMNEPRTCNVIDL